MIHIFFVDCMQVQQHLASMPDMHLRLVCLYNEFRGGLSIRQIRGIS